MTRSQDIPKEDLDKIISGLERIKFLQSELLDQGVMIRVKGKFKVHPLLSELVNLASSLRARYECYGFDLFHEELQGLDKELLP